MFKLEKLKTSLVVASLISAVAVTGAVADGSRTYKNGKKVIDGGVTYPVKNNKTGPYYVNPQVAKTKGFDKYGRKPTKNEIKAWDVDVMPDGTGLPDTKGGSVAEGEELYEKHCIMCHGDFGSGVGGYPKLAGGDKESLTNQRLQEGDDGPVRVIGSYWPHASTLFWYIKTGMPFPHPKSLKDDEVYALTAYLLSINDITVGGEELDDDFVLNKKNFLKIEMPNKDGFVPNIDGKNGLENIRKYLNNRKNYANGKRCMKNCYDYKTKVIVVNDIHEYLPPLSQVRDLPKEESKASNHPGKKLYEKSCAVCHNPDNSMGAPKQGVKADWDARLKNGKDAVYANGIKGKNAMPPKGGANVSDEEFKKAVDYMIDSAK
jgi:cytochrome c